GSRALVPARRSPGTVGQYRGATPVAGRVLYSQRHPGRGGEAAQLRPQAGDQGLPHHRENPAATAGCGGTAGTNGRLAHAGPLTRNDCQALPLTCSLRSAAKSSMRRKGTMACSPTDGSTKISLSARSKTAARLSSSFI